MRRPFSYIAAVVLVLLCASPLFASADYGTTSANFLTIPVAPVPSGIGQAYTAMYGTDSILYNPAGLGIMNYSSMSGAHNQYMLDMMQEYLAMNFRFSFGTIGAFYTSFSSDKFTSYSFGDVPGASIEAKFSAMGISFAKSWPYFEEDRGMADPMPITTYWTRLHKVEDFRPKTYRFSIGATAKRVSETLAYSTAGTFAFDAGALLILPGHIQLGFSSLNNGGKIKHEVKSFPLPQSIRFGAATDLHTKGDVMIFLFSADAVKYSYSDFFLNAGTEINIARVFQIRAGYSTQNEVIGSITAGAGMSLDIFGDDGFLKGARIDYAYINYQDFGATHRLGFQVIW